MRQAQRLSTPPSWIIFHKGSFGDVLQEEGKWFQKEDLGFQKEWWANMDYKIITTLICRVKKPTDILYDAMWDGLGIIRYQVLKSPLLLRRSTATSKKWEFSVYCACYKFKEELEEQNRVYNFYNRKYKTMENFPQSKGDRKEDTKTTTNRTNGKKT